ncbi:MAG: DUF1893 domain-containing protein [Clostridia bacterium]|nr:DUF1893 domain-containing protein [Clostridia bacterium]
MKDLEKAKALLLAPDSTYTCVLCRNDEQYTSEEKGIAPMMRFLDSGTRLDGFCAADRIVGKAAAMLFILAHVCAVHGEVMTETARRLLEENGIAVSFGTLTDAIINRRGDGLCPMEQAVFNVDDPQSAREAIRLTMQRLSKK